MVSYTPIKWVVNYGALIQIHIGQALSRSVMALLGVNARYLW